jgi:hypothetical protein
MWHPEPKNDAWREVHLAHVDRVLRAHLEQIKK